METIKIKRPYYNYLKPLSFVRLIGGLFESLGYHIFYNKHAKDNYFDIEITSRNNETDKYLCEIKYYSRPRFNPNSDLVGIRGLSKNLQEGEKGIYITTSICSEELHKNALEKNILILDINNLVYLIDPKHDLYQGFLSIIDFSINDIEAKKPFMEFFTNSYEIPNANNYTKQIDWENELKKIDTGIDDFTKYQSTCVEILKILFSDYLSIWEEQKKSNENLYRFDLICKIKNNINDDFFSTLNNYFNTRYIIFDFKNYSEKITQKEIYTTEKYLYDKALRKVAIIISRKGIDDNALKAIKGSIREQGKVIISLTDKDLLEMLKLHEKTENSTDYLSNILDQLLIELEK